MFPHVGKVQTVNRKQGKIRFLHHKLFKFYTNAKISSLQKFATFVLRFLTAFTMSSGFFLLLIYILSGTVGVTDPEICLIAFQRSFKSVNFLSFQYARILIMAHKLSIGFTKSDLFGAQNRDYNRSHTTVGTFDVFVQKAAIFLEKPVQ